MIVVGIQLGESRFRQIASNSKLVETTIIKLVLVPALTLLAVYWLPIPQIAKAVLVLSASFPSAVNMTLLGKYKTLDPAVTFINLTNAGVENGYAVFKITTSYGISYLNASKSGLTPISRASRLKYAKT